MKQFLINARGLRILAAAFLATAALAFSEDAVWRPKPQQKDALRVLVVTSGHSYQPSFYSLFDYDDIAAMVVPHPQAYERDMRGRYDILVLYDMYKELPPERQKNLRDFVEAGRGVVALHHALGDYQNWPWWYEEVVGGRFVDRPPGSGPGAVHDVDIAVTPVGDHPITRGLKPFRIWDETYKGVWISPRVNVILRTDHPTSDGPVGWIGPSTANRVAFLQLGHDRNAHLNPIYRQLVRNAMLWAAGRLESK
jgi:type 1 glutamine amidotransferase